MDANDSCVCWCDTLVLLLMNGGARCYNVTFQGPAWKATLHRWWQSVSTTSHYSCTFQPSTATHVRPTQSIRYCGGMWEVKTLCRGLVFICFISVFFWLQQAIKRRSSVPKQTFHWCTSRFFIFLCFADRFFQFYLLLFLFILSDDLQQQALQLVSLYMNRPFGYSWSNISLRVGFLPILHQISQSPTTRTSLIKETVRCEIPLCKCIHP